MRRNQRLSQNVLALSLSNIFDVSVIKNHPVATSNKPITCQTVSSQSLLWLLAVLLICSLTANARPELGPPSIKLRSNMANIVLAEFMHHAEDGDLILKKVEDIHNQADDRIRVRALPNAETSLAKGNRYVVAYVNWQVQRFPRTVKPRRDGAVIIHLPGASPALFPADDKLITLLQWEMEASLQSPPAMLPIILSGMNSKDAALRDFFTTELVTRATLHELLTAAQTAEILKHLADPDYPPTSRQLMLGNVEFANNVLTASQRLKVASEIVRDEPVHLASGSNRTGMVNAALDVLQQVEGDNHAELARRWLLADQSGLIESAAEVIYRQQATDLLSWLQQASAQTSGDSTTRELTLQNLIKRYSRMLAAQSDIVMKPGN